MVDQQWLPNPPNATLKTLDRDFYIHGLIHHQQVNHHLSNHQIKLLMIDFDLTQLNIQDGTLWEEVGCNKKNFDKCFSHTQDLI